MGKEKSIVTSLLNKADIEVNGERPWDIQVRNSLFYREVLRGLSLGLGDSYVEGWWDSKKPDQTIYQMLSLSEEELKKAFTWRVFTNLELVKFFITQSWAYFVNSKSKSKVWKEAAKHYDVDNELFAITTGKRMAYSCGYWKNAHSPRRSRTK